MQSYTVLCVKFIKLYARKLLLSLVVLKLIFNYQVFSTKLYAHEMFVSREFKTILRVRQKVFADPLAKATNAKNAGVSAVFPNLTTLDGWNMI